MILLKNPSARRIVKILSLLLISVLVFIPALSAEGGRKYAFVSLIIAVLSLAVFFSGYDKKRIGTARAVICAVLIAFSVVGRFIPLFKPVSAMTILCAVYLGKECGFMCGSLSAFISDFYFGIGPWTPFQMFAWGMIGFIGGGLGAFLKKSRVLMIIYGAFSGVLFSFIMDIWTVLWFNGGLDFSLYAGAIISALPYTFLYSLSNVIFLCIFARPFGEKLERLQAKYGI